MGHRTENVELTVLCLIQGGNRILLLPQSSGSKQFNES